MNADKELWQEPTSGGLDDLLADPFGTHDAMLPEEGQKIEPAAGAKPSRLVDMLPEENRQKAYELAKQIDPSNHQSVILYGTQAQSKLLNFSHAMLDQVQKKISGKSAIF